MFLPHRAKVEKLPPTEALTPRKLGGFFMPLWKVGGKLAPVKKPTPTPNLPPTPPTHPQLCQGVGGKISRSLSPTYAALPPTPPTTPAIFFGFYFLLSLATPTPYPLPSLFFSFFFYTLKKYGDVGGVGGGAS